MSKLLDNDIKFTIVGSKEHFRITESQLEFRNRQLYQAYIEKNRPQTMRLAKDVPKLAIHYLKTGQLTGDLSELVKCKDYIDDFDMKLAEMIKPQQKPKVPQTAHVLYDNGMYRSWNTSLGEILCEKQLVDSNSFTVSKGNVYVGHDNRIMKWRALDGKYLGSYAKVVDQVTQVTSDDDYLYGIATGLVYQWRNDFSTTQCQRMFCPPKLMMPVCLSVHNGQAYVGYDNDTIASHNCSDGEVKSIFKIPVGSPGQISCISVDKEYIYAVTYGGVICRWRLDDPNVRFVYVNKERIAIKCCAVGPNGILYYAFHDSNGVRQFEFKSNSSEVLCNGLLLKQITHLQVDADQRLLYVGVTDSIRVYNIDTREFVRSFADGRDHIKSFVVC